MYYTWRFLYLAGFVFVLYFAPKGGGEGTRFFTRDDFPVFLLAGSCTWPPFHAKPKDSHVGFSRYSLPRPPAVRTWRPSCLHASSSACLYHARRSPSRPAVPSERDYLCSTLSTHSSTHPYLYPTVLGRVPVPSRSWASQQEPKSRDVSFMVVVKSKCRCIRVVFCCWPAAQHGQYLEGAPHHLHQRPRHGCPRAVRKESA